jgi:hypothetical protein
MQLLMQLVSYKMLYELEQAGILDETDINRLKDKIKLEFVDTCSVVNGKYEIKETLDHTGKHIKYETEALNLKVNYCGNFFIIRQMPDIFERIVTHELGHHVYYYKDRVGRENFSNICREGKDAKKSICDEKDFVSDYAQTMDVEDYAEHFMSRFLNNVPEGSEKL